MTKEDKLDMFKLRLEGYSLQDIGDKYGCTREYVRQILDVKRAPKTMKCIYPNINKWMKSNNKRQADIAKMAGRSQAYVSAVFTGKNEPKKSLIDLVTKMTGLTYEQAFKMET